MEKNKKKITIITVATVIVYVAVMIGWFLYTPAGSFKQELPGRDHRPAGTARSANDVKIGEFFMKYADLTTSLTGKWTCFRGDKGDNIINTTDKLKTSGDYPEVWNVTTGEGYSAPAIYNGRVYLLDYDETLRSDMLRCFSLESGKELWRRWYRVPMKRNHGFSRTIPVVGEDYVVTVGPSGQVMCCDPISGDMKWSCDLEKRFNTEVPFWYTGQCPRVDDGNVVLAPAGKDTLLVGMDVKTGAVAWATPNKPGFKMSHSSVMTMTIGEKRQYVYIGVGGACGVSAEKADRGALLWTETKWQPSVVAPSPCQVGPNKIFLVAGYGSGGAMLEVSGSGSNWSANVTDQYKAALGASSEQQTPIFYNNMLITVPPKDGGGDRGKLVVYSPNNLHKTIWTSTADERFGSGPYLLINKDLFVFNEEGTLFLFEVENNQMKMLKKQKIMDGVDAWGPLAYADGYLIVRDSHNVKCLKVI